MWIVNCECSRSLWTCACGTCRPSCEGGSGSFHLPRQMQSPSTESCQLCPDEAGTGSTWWASSLPHSRRAWWAPARSWSTISPFKDYPTSSDPYSRTWRPQSRTATSCSLRWTGSVGTGIPGSSTRECSIN